MDPITPGIISGLLANGLTALITKAAGGKASAAALPQPLQALLAQPAARLGRALADAGVAEDDRLRLFLVSADVEALGKQLFSTCWAGDDDGSIDAFRQRFRELHAELPGRTRASAEADTLFAALLDACTACIDAAIDRNLVAGHEAKSALRQRQSEAKQALRHQQVNEQLAEIQQAIASLAADRPANSPALDRLIDQYLPWLQAGGGADGDWLLLNDAPRDQLLRDIATRLHALAGVDRSRPASMLAASGADPDAQRPSTPMPPGVLAVILTASADGGTRIDYRLKGASPPARHWSATETEALRQAAGSAQGPSGEQLFEQLFGSWPASAHLFRALFADVDGLQPRPIDKEARLRIVTTDPELLRLPWGRLAWQGRRLIDYFWEIVTAAEPAPRHRCQTLPDAELLVVTDPALPTGTPRPLALETLLAGLRPAKTGRVRAVTDPVALDQALTDMQPHALFIELACAEQNGQPVLLFGADPPRAYPLAALERALLRADPAPCLVALALRGDAALALMARLAEQLGRRVALVLRLTPNAADNAVPDPDPDPARRALIALLPAWLRDGDDPVAALHRLLRAAPTPAPARTGSAAAPPCDPGLIGIHAGYRDWQTMPVDRSRADPPPLRALDRDDQKAKVAEHLRKLARRSHDRVLMIVAHGSPEDLVPELSGQLQWHLEQSVSGQAALAGQVIGLPEIPLPMGEDSLDEAIDQLHHAFEPHLMETLRAAVDTELGELIRRHAPRGLARGERAVLWLDWGHVPIPADAGSARDSAERRAAAALYALPHWCAETLNLACPRELRLVCMLGLELPAADYPSMAALFTELRKQPWYNRDGFRFLALDPLGQVDDDHLHEYLTEIDTGLDQFSRGRLVDLILSDKHGDFNATVALLEQGAAIGWPALLEQLSARQHPPAPRKRRGLFS